MRIGIAGPVSQLILRERLPSAHGLSSDGYSFPLTAYLASELLDRGHEVVVFALDPAASSVRRFHHGRLTLHVSPYRPRGRDRARDFFRAERRSLATAMRAESCDVIHAHWTYEFAMAALSVQKEVVVTIHDWAPAVLRHFHDPYRAMRLFMQGAVLARAITLTAPSPYLAERAARFSKAKHVAVVPNGVPDWFFRPRPQRRGGDVPIIGAVNHGLSARKNVMALVRAFGKIRDRFPDAQLHLAGQGFDPEGPAARQAATVGPTNQIVFHGPLSQAEMRGFLPRSSVFVHPSLEESFGMVVVEAMATAVPVVAGESSGAVPWVVGDGNTGALVDVRSPTAIAAAVESLLTDERRWADSSTYMFKRASSRFRLSAVVDAYETIYRSTQT